MKKTVENYISDLLYLEDCIIIPDFGGFIVNYKPAVINKKNGEIEAPSKSILFNNQLVTNDGLLANYIAQAEKISNKEALNIILSYAKEINTKLYETKILRLNNIGLFTLGTEDNILFTQEKGSNYNLESFGMATINSRTITKEDRVEEKIIDNVQKIEQQIYSPQVMLRAAAVLVPLIIISFLSVNQEKNITTIYEKMAVFNFFTPEKKIDVKEVVANTNVKNIETKINHTVITTPKNYHIIIGSFQEKSNAEKMHAKLLRTTNNVAILKNGKLLRVSLNRYESKDDALIALEKIKKEHVSAWILTQ